jgi:hypothetical protein
MDAKFKSKTHLIDMFFIFGTIFCAFGLKLRKSINITYIFFFGSKKVSKNAEFHADFKSVEKVFKKCTKKAKSKTILMNMSKSRKSAYFHHIFANNVFWCIFF